MVPFQSGTFMPCPSWRYRNASSREPVSTREYTTILIGYRSQVTQQAHQLTIKGCLKGLAVHTVTTSQWRHSTAAWLSLWGMGARCLHPTARVLLLPRQRGDCDYGARKLSLLSSLRGVYIFLSSDTVRPDQEAHSSATSGPTESMLSAHSSSEELDVMELRQMWKVRPPPHRHPHMKTCCYVMTRAIVKLNLNWSVEKQESAPGRLDERFLAKISQHRGQAFAQYGTVNMEAVSRSPTQGTWLHA